MAHFRLHGHEALSLSDFGFWSCQACMKSGSDWTHPEDHPCELRGVYTVIQMNWGYMPVGRTLYEGDLNSCAQYLIDHIDELQGHDIRVESAREDVG